MIRKIAKLNFQMQQQQREEDTVRKTITDIVSYSILMIFCEFQYDSLELMVEISHKKSEMDFNNLTVNATNITSMVA